MVTAEEALRRLSIGDQRMLAAITAEDSGMEQLPAHLNERTRALLNVAALIALDAQPSSYLPAVQAAERCGVLLDDLVAVLAAVAAAVGSARVVAAAPRLALAAGYDVDAALE